MDALEKAVDNGPVRIAELSGKAAGELQTALQQLGYKLAIDGDIGPATRQAFADFKEQVNQRYPTEIGAGSFKLLMEALSRKEGLGEAIEAGVSNKPSGPVSTGLTSKMLPTGKAVYVERPILDGGSFTWAEATKDGARWPDSASVEGNIIAIAKVLETAKRKLGGPAMIITSWNRPPAVNRAVGGARFSRHVTGDGVDFYVPTMSVADVFGRLKNWYYDDSIGGIAPSYRSGFVHLDKRGHYQTWTY